MKKFIRSIARTMGLAALVSLGGMGCRFDLDSLRKDEGVQITDSGMKDGLILADGSYADGKMMEDGPKDGYNAGDALLIADGSLDALLIPDAAIDAPLVQDAAILPDSILDTYVPPPDASITDGYVPLPDAPFLDAAYLPDAVVPDAMQDAVSPDAGPGGVLPSSEYLIDNHCLALLHFNVSGNGYLDDECSAWSLTDVGTTQTESLSGFSQARAFDGSSRLEAYRNITEDLGPADDLTNKLTVEALIKPASGMNSFNGGFGNIFHTVYYGAEQAYQGFALFIMNGALAFNIGLNDGFLFSVTGPASFPTTTYTHIAGTYDGMKGRVLVNGIVVGEATMSGVINQITNPSPVYYVGADGGGNNAFLGAIDEVRVSNTVRYGPTACYLNDFNEDSDLEDLVIQNGTWVRASAGYLKQTEATPILQGYRMSYLSNAMYSNLDATVKVRVPDGFTSDAHTGLLFRYSRNSQSGYDYSIDKGYILDIENGTGTTFDLTLEDAYISRIHTLQVQGSFDTWHTLRVLAIGDVITAYFNGQEIFTLQNFLYSTGHIGFGSHASISHFDNLEVCPLE